MTLQIKIVHKTNVLHIHAVYTGPHSAPYPGVPIGRLDHIKLRCKVYCSSGDS